MASIQPRLPPSSTAPTPPPPEQNGLRGKAAHLGKMILELPRPFFKHGPFWISPAKSPSEALKGMNILAVDSLARAEQRGIRPAPQVIPPEPAQQTVPQSSYWKIQIKLKTDALAQQLSVYNTLLEMRDRCKLPDENNLQLIRFTRLATEGDQPPSVWDLFTGHYSLSFFQKIKAAWFYWVYYKTSLISKTVATYLDDFIEKITGKLIGDEGAVRNAIFHTSLDNTNDFLVADQQATKDFAYGRQSGNLKDCRNRAIEAVYGFDLASLCQTCSERLVRPDAAPIVPFFSSFKTMPILGRLFKELEWIINRFVIQRSMKHSILPNALKQAVVNGVQATRPDNLPFAIHITRFFASRLEILKTSLAKKEWGSSAKSEPKPPELTRLLSPTIKHLKWVLDVETLQTAPELRKKIESIENGWDLPWDKYIEERIEKSIFEAGHLLFDYLNEMAKSGELFAHFLDLACTPFQREVKSPASLLMEYEAEHKRFKDVAYEVVDELVRQAVVGKDRTEVIEQASTKSFQDWRTMAKGTFEKLNALCLQMNQQNEAQIHTASFLEALREFAIAKEIEEGIERLEPVYQDPIWRKITPLCERAEALVQRVVKEVQPLQEAAPLHRALETHLRSMEELFRSIRGQLGSEPRPSLVPLAERAKSLVQTIGNSGGLDPSELATLQGSVNQIARAAEALSNAERSLGAVQELTGSSPGSGPGLLDQLLEYQRGVHPKGFKPKDCLAAVRKSLNHLPQGEAAELHALIGNGSSLNTKWVQLISPLLQRIYNRESAVKATEERTLTAILNGTSQSTEQLTLKYQTIGEESRTTLRTELQTLRREVADLRRDLETVQVHIPPSLTPDSTNLFVGIASAGIGTFGALVGGPIGAALGAGSIWVGAYYKQWIQKDIRSKSRLPSTVMAGLSAGVGGALSYLVPGSWTYMGAVGASALGGSHAVDGGVSKLQEKAHKRAMGILTSAYSLIVHDRTSRVSKGILTRFIKALTPAAE